MDLRPQVLRLLLLGSFRLVAVDGRDVALPSKKACALLAYLALSPGSVVGRGKIAGLFWSESSDAKSSLRQCIKGLRDLRSDAGADIVKADSETLSLNLDAVWVDAMELERAAVRADSGDPEAIVGLYAGDLLDGLSFRDAELEHWLTIERIRLRTLACSTIEQQLSGPAGVDKAFAARAAKALVSMEPVHEQAHRLLMRWHAENGDAAAAVRQYLECHNALAHKLDLSPSAETESLLARIRGGALSKEPRDLTTPAPTLLSQKTLGTPQIPFGAKISVELRQLDEGLSDTALPVLVASLREALSRASWISVVDGVLMPQPEAPVRPGDAAAYRVEVGLVKLADRARATTEIVHVLTGRLVWAEHFDRPLNGDLLSFVDELGSKLARVINREIKLTEIARASRDPIEPESAYDLLLRAVRVHLRPTPAAFDEADCILATAREADPNEPLVRYWQALNAMARLMQGWAQDEKAAREEIDEIVRRTLEQFSDDARCLAVSGRIFYSVKHDLAQGFDLLERAVQADRNSATAWINRALVDCYIGDARAALHRVRRYSRGPWWRRDILAWYVDTIECTALMLNGDYYSAAEVGHRAVQQHPNFHPIYRPLIASLGHLKRFDDAEHNVSEFLLRAPHFTIEWFRSNVPTFSEQAQDHYIRGLRLAGVPER